MPINYSVYGRENEWFDCYYQQAEIVNKNKIAYFGENAKTLSQGVANNKLSYSIPIDKTLSYCGLGEASALSHVAFLGYKDGERKLLEYNDRQVTNFAFFEKTTDTNYTNSGFLNITELNKNMWVENMATAFNNTGDLSPLSIVNPHNIILYITVDGKAELSHGWTTVSLSYLPTAIQLYNWRYFRHATVTAYFGSDIDNVPYSTSAGHAAGHANYKPLQISILDKYDCTEKNTSFYMYGGGVNSQNTIWGFPAVNDISADTNLINLAFVTENAKEHIKIASNNEGVIEYYPEMIEDIKKSAACFGLYFTGNATAAANGDLTNSDMYIGLIDEDGVGRGRYLQGADTVNAPQAASDFKDMHTIDYDPSRPVDPNTYAHTTDFNRFANTSASSYPYYLAPSSILSTYSPVISALQEVAQMPEPSDTWFFNSSFVFQEPVECILAWRKIFFSPPSGNLGTLKNITIGWFETEEESSKAYTYQGETERIQIADIVIFPKHGNFLDYEPYTKMSLFVPYCGMKELPMASFMGHTMQLYLVKNYRTGDLEVLIMLDNKYWGNMTGNASVEYPLSGNKSIEYIQRRLELQHKIDDSLWNGMSSVVGNAAGATISLAHGNIPGAVIQAGAGVLNLMQSADSVAYLDYQLEHTPNKIVNIQKGISATTVGEILYPYILIQRPRTLSGYNPELFGKTTGFATLENKYKNDLHGYTEASNPILDGIPCTDTERNLIVKALQEGCIFDYEE